MSIEKIELILKNARKDRENMSVKDREKLDEIDGELIDIVLEDMFEKK